MLRQWGGKPSVSRCFEHSAGRSVPYYGVDGRRPIKNVVPAATRRVIADFCNKIRQKRTSSRLFDHLVGASEQRWRYGEADCSGGLEVDDQLELDWGLDGKVARLLALQDAIDIGPYTPIIIN
jgi:hypothetical protein